MKNQSMKKYSTRLVFIVFSIICITLTQGCATTPVRNNLSGSTDQSTPYQGDKGKFWWEKPGFKWQNYNKVMLDPITASLYTREKRKTPQQEQLDELVSNFRDIVRETLGAEYLSDKPGQDVLKIKAVITDVDMSNPALNFFTTAVAFVPFDTGGASIEVDFIDSVTGERVAHMKDRKKGNPMQAISGLKRFGHTKKAFKHWAKELRTALVQNP